jgi:hypothetical protein
MKLIKILFAVFFILQVVTFGQSSSSYSRLGIGDADYSFSAYGNGIGGLGISLSTPSSFDIVNPASWNKINRTRFSIDMLYSGSFLSGNSVTGFNGKAQFNGLALAFPVSDSNGATVVMGMAPYSTISYNVSQNSVDLTQASGSYQIIYNGNGGLSKAFIGTSYRLPFDVSLGATLNYYFGTLNYNSSTQFANSDASNSSYARSYNPSGVGSNFGLISPDLSTLFHSGSISDLHIGIAAEYLGKLRTDTILTSTTTTRTDTVQQGTVEMKVPVRLMAGLSFVINQKYYLSLDAAAQDWSTYSFNDVQPGDLRNATKLSLGFEYIPKQEFGTTPWQQIVWRAGISYEQTQYQVDGTGINQFSIAGGFSYPLNQGSTLDISAMYGSRGSSQPDLIKENFVKLNFGLSIGELWFWRPAEQ